jgi:hypothetical protein
MGNRKRIEKQIRDTQEKNDKLRAEVSSFPRSDVSLLTQIQIIQIQSQGQPAQGSQAQVAA